MLFEWLFFKLLFWFCEKRMDQWERWELQTKFGPVSIHISRSDDGHGYGEIER